MNIYVGNLAYSVTEDSLRAAFSEFGEITSCNVITDKFSGRSKGFGFVEMADEASGKAAIEALNEQPLEGRPVKVNEAKPREPRR